MYIFIDESGNFDFSTKGTNHFVLCAVTALDPITPAQNLQALKYEILANGIDIDCFHASPDVQIVRDAVFDEIELLKNIRINYIYADKHKTPASYQNPLAFYSLLSKALLKYVFKGYTETQYHQIIVIFDKALTQKQQKAFLGVVKPELKTLGKPYKIYFHSTMADFNGQIADYCSWAKYVELERNETRPIDKLHRIPKTNFDIFSRGEINYY